MKYIVSVCAIIAVAAIEITALCNGINGTALSLSIAGIAGLGGYNLKSILGKEKNGDKC